MSLRRLPAFLLLLPAAAALATVLELEAALARLGRGALGPGVAATALATFPQKLATRGADEVAAELERHLGKAVTQKQRHNRLCRLLEAWLQDELGCACLACDKPLAMQPWAAAASKKSRKVDVIATLPRGGAESCGGEATAPQYALLEVTVAWDGRLADRIREKECKYADLPAVAAAANATVRPVHVMAIGALGTVPDETEAALHALLDAAEAASAPWPEAVRAARQLSAARLLRRMRTAVLSAALAPLSSRPRDFVLRLDDDDDVEEGDSEGGDAAGS
uniref:Uncharacterized protein n=1 Tax=Phaeomonas parva TaxID=124430 RepID=A0A7S1XSS6_9STRA